MLSEAIWQAEARGKSGILMLSFFGNVDILLTVDFFAFILDTE